MNKKNILSSKKIILPIIIVLLLVLGKFAYFKYDSTLEYIDGNVLNLPYINQWNDEDLLDNPWKNSQFHMGLLYRNLFLSDSNFENVECDLAENCQISSDGLSYTISLKNNLFWSDGETITANDVKFSIEAVLQSQTANGLYSAAFSKIIGYEDFKLDTSLGLSGLEVIDENTIVINLSTQHPTMMQVLAQFVILPQHCFTNSDLPNIDFDEYWKNPVVSGMYKVGEVVSYETIQLVRNEYYSETPPKIDEVLIHINYKFANLDYYSTNNITEIINYRSMRSMNEHKVDILFYRYFVFNLEGYNGDDGSAMDDINLRKAISLAIDRESLLYDIYLDSGTIINSGVPSSHASYSGETIDYNPQLAVEFLEASDYDLSRQLRLAYYYTDTTSKSFMAAVALNLEEIGFTVELCPLTTSVELYEDREYDILLKGLSAFDISEWYFGYSSANPNLLRLLGINNEFESLVQELNTTVDAEVEDALLKELQTLEHENLYKIPLFTLSQVLYINEDRVDLPSNISFGNTWYKYDVDFENWTIKRE